MKFPIVTSVLCFALLLSFLALSTMLVFGSSQSIEMFKFSLDDLQNIVFYNFVHVDYGHLLVNLAVIIAAGLVIETRLGSRDAATVFFAGSVFSAILFVATSPDFGVLGASAGAVSMLATATAVDTKKSVAFVIATMLLATAGIFIINGYLENRASGLKAEITVLEQSRKSAIEQNDMQLAAQTQQKIEQSTVQISQIREGVELKKRIPSSTEIHVFAALFGAAYPFFFARKQLLQNTKEVLKLVGSFRK